MNTVISPSNPRAAELRTVLMILDQIDQTDSAPDAVKVGELPFWTRTKSAKLAGDLDRVLVRLRRAMPVPGASKLVEELLTIGRKEGRNMMWLGERISRLYRVAPQCRLKPRGRAVASLALTLALAFAAPFAARAADPASVPATPFGFGALAGDRVDWTIVPRASVENSFTAASAAAKPESFEREWRQVLAVRWSAADGIYREQPAVLSTEDYGLMTIRGVDRVAAELPGLPTNTPFGSGSTPRVARRLADAVLYGGPLGYENQLATRWKTVEWKNGAAYISGFASTYEHPAAPLGFDYGSLKILSECRAVGEAHLLCRTTIDASVAGKAVAQRVEYHGFEQWKK